MKPLWIVWFGVVAGLLLPGCSTPKAMLDLADKTSGNVALLNKYISTFATNQQELTAERIAISAGKAEQFAELATRNQTRMEAMRLAGMTSKLTLISNIVASSDAAATAQNQLLLVTSNQTRIMQATQLQLNTFSKQLSSLSSSLSQLAKNDSLETRIANLVVFAQAVQTNMAAAQTNTAAKAQAMKTDATQLKAKTASEISALSR
ncbi:MAG: hypothetical protein ACLQVY_11955 [Limisphaerales bacterium]